MKDNDIRRYLAKAIQDAAKEDDDLKGYLVTAWTAVLEWVGPDGKLHASIISGDHDGEPLVIWKSMGHIRLADSYADLVSKTMYAQRRSTEDD